MAPLADGRVIELAAAGILSCKTVKTGGSGPSPSMLSTLAHQRTHVGTTARAA